MTNELHSQQEGTSRHRPTLYTFRRCPYAMRARMALSVSEQQVSVREVLLRDKPTEMIAASAKATVPVLELADGQVLEESLTIMDWALRQNDPKGWLLPETGSVEEMYALIAESDGPFKHHLDRYKYATRYGEETDPIEHRSQGAEFLKKLNMILGGRSHLFGTRDCLADIAIFPFVRQFANTDRAWFDSQPLPSLQAWLEDHLNSELFIGIMHKWKVWSAGDEEPVFPEMVKQDGAA